MFVFRREGNLSLAKAPVTQLNMETERYTVRASVTGRVLQLDLRAGEYVHGGTRPRRRRDGFAWSLLFCLAA